MSDTLCGFCGSSSQYTCPRCHAFYCSLKCYQSPSHQQCSEDFYKDCVTKELSGENLNDESKKKMVEVLKRMNHPEDEDDEEEEDSDDEEEPEELAERLEGLNLDNADEIWKKLTKDERREFEELLKSGDVTGIIPEYVPWWKFRKEEKKIEEIGAESSDDAFKENCPAVIKDIPNLSSITKVPPSPHVKCGLLNVLYAYSYAVRFFAGDYQDVPCQFVEVVALLSGNLSKGENYDISDTALESAASEVGNYPFLAVSLDFARSVKKDVFEITQGPSVGEHIFYILSALSDLKEQLKSAKQALKTGEKKKLVINVGSDLPVWKRHPERKPSLSLEDTKKHLRKVDYYLSWTKGFGDQYIL